MVGGVRYSRIMLLHQLFLTGYFIIVIRLISRRKLQLKDRRRKLGLQTKNYNPSLTVKINDASHVSELVACIVSCSLELVGIDFPRFVQGGDRVCELDLVSYAACCLAQAIEYL